MLDQYENILNEEADRNAQDQVQGKTALHFALMERSEIATAELLECREVNVNIKDNRKWTALHQATSWHDIAASLFKKIMEKSSDLNAKTILGRTALHLALRHRSAIAIKELLNCEQNNDGQIVNTKNGRGKTTLHYAAQWRDIPPHLFEAILEKTSDVNARDIRTGYTALRLAIEERSVTATGQLLKRVDANIENNEKRTLTHLMDLWLDVPTDIRQLLDKRLNLTADYKRSPADEALSCYRGFHSRTVSYTAMISFLPGLTALNYRLLKADICLILESEGESQLRVSDAGYLPEEMLNNKPIESTKSTEVFKRLMTNNDESAEKEESPQQPPALTGEIKNSIATGTDVNAKDSRGRTALHYCIIFGSLILVSILYLF